MPDPETPDPLPDPQPEDPPTDPEPPPPPPLPPDTSERSAQLKSALSSYTIWRAAEGVEVGAKRIRVTLRAPSADLSFIQGLSPSDWSLIADLYPEHSFGCGGLGAVKQIDARTQARTVRVLTD